MVNNCAPFIADLFLNCNELQFMTKVSQDHSKQHLIQKFINTFRYLVHDISAINNEDFSMLTKKIYPAELTLNIAKTMNTAILWILISLSLTGRLIQVFMIKEMICYFLSLIIHFKMVTFLVTIHLTVFI